VLFLGQSHPSEYQTLGASLSAAFSAYDHCSEEMACGKSEQVKDTCGEKPTERKTPAAGKRQIQRGESYLRRANAFARSNL